MLLAKPYCDEEQTRNHKQRSLREENWSWRKEITIAKRQKQLKPEKTVNDGELEVKKIGEDKTFILYKFEESGRGW